MNINEKIVTSEISNVSSNKIKNVKVITELNSKYTLKDKKALSEEELKEMKKNKSNNIGDIKINGEMKSSDYGKNKYKSFNIDPLNEIDLDRNLIYVKLKPVKDITVVTEEEVQLFKEDIIKNFDVNLINFFINNICEYGFNEEVFQLSDEDKTTTRYNENETEKNKHIAMIAKMADSLHMYQYIKGKHGKNMFLRGFVNEIQKVDRGNWFKRLLNNRGIIWNGEYLHLAYKYDKNIKIEDKDYFESYIKYLLNDTEKIDYRLRYLLK